MAEEELMPFDPNMKKKKKKKKTAFDPDAAMTEGEGAADSFSGTAEAEPAEEQQSPDQAAGEDVLNLDFSGMKKKKKKKKIDLGELGEALPEMDEGEPVTEGIPEMAPAPDSASTDLTFALPLRKKKKKRNVEIDTTAGDGMGDGGEEGGENSGKAWHGSDRDYTYDELLSRVFDIMREKNPDMIAGEKKKFVMRPPQVVRVGARKSSFVNFAEITRLLHRQPKHVLAFLMAELGTSGSVDGNNQLIIRGKYNQKQIESVLRRYIKEYVTCHTCRSPDTLLQKDTRLFFLQCETCGSRCSVANIKSGFQAVTGKRAAIRAKTA